MIFRFQTNCVNWVIKNLQIWDSPLLRAPRPLLVVVSSASCLGKMKWMIEPALVWLVVDLPASARKPLWTSPGSAGESGRTSPPTWDSSDHRAKGTRFPSNLNSNAKQTRKLCGQEIAINHEDRHRRLSSLSRETWLEWFSVFLYQIMIKKRI